MTGKFSDGTSGEVNFFDAEGKLKRDKKIHSIEIEFDDHTTIRRELVNNFDKLGNFKATTQNYFIDGEERGKHLSGKGKAKSLTTCH